MQLFMVVLASLLFFAESFSNNFATRPTTRLVISRTLPLSQQRVLGSPLFAEAEDDEVIIEAEIVPIATSDSNAFIVGTTELTSKMVRVEHTESCEERLAIVGTARNATNRSSSKNEEPLRSE